MTTRSRRQRALLAYLMRNRAVPIELGLIAVLLATARYLAYRFDVYSHASGIADHDHRIDPDELVILCVLALVAMLIFGIRRYLAQHREMRRRLAATGRLRESERRLSSLLQTVELMSVMLNLDGQITYCNEHFLHITGWPLEDVLGRNWFDIFVPDEIEAAKAFFKELTANRPHTWHNDRVIRTRSGERRTIRWNNTVHRSATGEVVGTASIGEDITLRLDQEAKIGRLLHMQQLLSSVNQLIVRVRDRDPLLKLAAEIAEENGFVMAWMGLVQADGQIKPVTSGRHLSGKLGFIATSLASPEHAVVTRQVLGGEPYVCNDVANEPGLCVLREAALTRGYRSFATLPIRVNHRVAGCLALYAGQVNVFDAEELKVLGELAVDIAYALEFITRDEQLDYLSSYDPITGLANRQLFRSRLADQLIASAQGRRAVAVIAVDLARFKAINDLVYRSGGNEVLQHTAERLITFTGSAHQVARAEGDRFWMVLPGIISSADCLALLKERFWPLWDPSMEVGGLELRVGVRIGIALVDPRDATDDVESLMRNAEAALKSTKASGDLQQLYVRGMGEASIRRLTLEWRVRQAAEKRLFQLYYQPKVSLASGRICGAEALLRWNSPGLGWVSPGQFVPLLEETGLILEVGRWALMQAATDRQLWQQAGLQAPRVAVNVSPVQLRQPDFVKMVQESIGPGSSSEAGIELEVTESMLMTDVDDTVLKLQQLRALGLTVSIDDFGTGYSSLAYLAKLPIGAIKIDRSFVIKMIESREMLVVVSTIVSMARALNLKTVAEGVETAEQLAGLAELQCDEMQGYLYSPAVPAAEFAELLRQDRVLTRSGVEPLQAA